MSYVNDSEPGENSHRAGSPPSHSPRSVATLRHALDTLRHALDTLSPIGSGATGDGVPRRRSVMVPIGQADETGRGAGVVSTGPRLVTITRGVQRWHRREARASAM